MKDRKLTVFLNEEAWSIFESLMKEANENNDSGTITFSNLINEMIPNAKVDIRSLQLKYADYRKTLKVLSSRKDIDLDQVVKILNEIRNKTPKRKASTSTEEASE
jgi:hypothetical protein